MNNTRKAITMLCAAVFAVCSAAPAPAQAPDTFDAPMKSLRDRPSLDVMVNGKGPYTFIIDTGAGGSARVSQHVADALGLPVVGKVEARGLGGTTTESLVELSIKVGSLEFSNIQASVSPDTIGGRALPWDGVLGFKLFANYLLTLDYLGNRIEVTSGTLASAPGAVDFLSPNDIPVVHGNLAGFPMDFDVDSGGSGGVGIDPKLSARLTFAKPLQTVGRACGSGGCVDVQAGSVAGTLSIGSLSIVNPEITVLPLPAATGNLGYRFLRGYRITFDQRSKKVLFAQKAA